MVKKVVVKKAPSRFAHTLVTAESTGHGKNMQQAAWARQQLGPVPRLTKKDGVIPLSQIVGADVAIQILRHYSALVIQIVVLTLLLLH